MNNELCAISIFSTSVVDITRVLCCTIGIEQLFEVLGKWKDGKLSIILLTAANPSIPFHSPASLML